MKNLLYLIFVGVVIWVVYATFFGNSDDKAMRDRLFKGLSETGSAITDILQSQKGRYNAGEYDQALDKLSAVIEQLKKAEGGTGEKAAEVARLEKQKAELESLIATYEQSEAQFEKARQAAAEATAKAKRGAEPPVAPSTAPLEAKLEEIQGTLNELGE